MAELIARLLLLFNTEMVGTVYQFRSVHIMDNFTMETKLHVDHLPALIITPVGESHEPGPFANTAREVFNIRLRIVARSADEYAYQVAAVSGTNQSKTIHWLSDKVRDVLYQNKRLVSSTFEMRPKYDVTDLNVLWGEGAGQISARDISISYTNLELYEGMQNEQASLALPEPFAI